MTGPEKYRILSTTVQRQESAERRFYIEGLPPLVEYQRNYHGQGPVDVLLHVDQVILVWLNGEFRAARVEGRRLKKDGKPGQQHGYRNYTKRWFTEHADEIPDWLRDLVHLSPEPSMLEYQTQQDQARRREKIRQEAR